MKQAKYKCHFNNQVKYIELDHVGVIPGKIITIDGVRYMINKRIFNLSEGIYDLYLNEQK